MATFILNENDLKLPPTAQAGDIVIYGNDTYRLYEDPLRGLRMHYLGEAQAYLAQESEAVALANEMRLALSGPLADLERQNMVAEAEAALCDLEIALGQTLAANPQPFRFRSYVDDALEAERDLDATQAAASNRWGW